MIFSKSALHFCVYCSYETRRHCYCVASRDYFVRNSRSSTLPNQNSSNKNTTTYDWPISTRVRCPRELLADCEFALREVNHLGLNIRAWLCNSFRSLSELTWGWTDRDPSRNSHYLLSNCFGCNIIYAGILCTRLYLGLHIGPHLVCMWSADSARTSQRSQKC